MKDKESGGLNQIDVAFLRAARAGNLDKVINFLSDGGEIHTCNANGLNALHLSAKEGHLEVMVELIKRGASVNATTKKGNTALHIGALAGQRGAVEVLLENNAAVNSKAQNGFTPLYMAAQEGHADVVKVLLTHGANQQATTEDGFTPIDVAVQQGHEKVVAILLHHDARKGYRSLHTAARKDFAKAAKLLLQKGHQPDVEAPNGFTPLHIAAKYGNLNVATVLIQNGATIDYKTKNYIIAPLHVAAKYGHLNLVTLLVERGSKVDIPNKDSLTPLHCAARDGHEKVVEYLIQKGASLTARTKHGLTPLHMSCQGNHPKTSDILIENKAPVNAVATNGLTPLHIAAHYGHVDIAQLLLDKGADTDARARNGFTPLHVACKKNREQVIQLLLKYGANVHSANEGGQTPMHVATYYGNVTLVLILLQHGGSPDITNVRGETSLHIACRRKQITIVRLLLRNGAAVDAKSQDRETPLHIAVRTKNLEMTNLLLDHGASPDSVDKNKCTPLHIAAREGNEELAATLLEHGANVMILNKKGFTPLHEAARNGHVEIVKMLLKYYETPDPEGKHGLTPLHVASHYDHVNVAVVLLDNKASPYAMAKNGFTPLHIASKKNQKEIATMLLERGVEPDTTTQTGISPLHLAAKEGHAELCKLLMDNGASPGITTNNGLTPLHLTARENRVEVAKLLLKFQAPINAQTVSGFTPLHIACVYGHWEIVKLLLEEGAEVEAKTKNGYQPLHLAAQYGHKIIIEILLQHNASPDALTNDGYTALYIAQMVLKSTNVVDILTKVTHIHQTIHLKRKPGEEGEDLPAITFSAEPEELEEEEVLDALEQGENEEAEQAAIEESYDRFMTMEEMVEVADDSDIKVAAGQQKPGRDSGIFSTRYSGFFQEHTPLAGSRSSDLDRSRYSDLNMSNSLQVSSEVIGITEAGFVEAELPSSLADMQVDNVPLYEPPVSGGFLVSFLVDARGGTMESTQTGIKVVLPPRSCQMPTRITCRLLRLNKPTLLPPLREGEALGCRVLDIGPSGLKFLQPIYLEVPYFASLRDGERELVVMKTEDGGWNWEDVSVEDMKDMHGYQDDNADAIFPSRRYAKISTRTLPERFAVVSRLKKEVFSVGARGENIRSAVLPSVQVNVPEGAVTAGTKMLLQVQPVDENFNNLEEWVTVSPVVTLEPADITFKKPVTVTIPCPLYSGPSNEEIQPSLRLLCCFPKDAKASTQTPSYQWQDITDSTPLTVIGANASFTIDRPARYWLIETRNPDNVTADARLIYRKLTAVPYLAKFVVFAKLSADGKEARLRIFCITDDKIDKTLEGQTGFVEVARSRDVEVFDGRPVHIRCVGNLAPVQREPMHLNFFSFRENRLSVSVKLVDPDQPMSCRLAFLKEPKKDRQGNIQTMCNLNLNLSEKDLQRDIGARKLPDSLLHLVALEAANDWKDLGKQLGFTDEELNDIEDRRSGAPDECAEEVLKTWRDTKEAEPDMPKLEQALKDTGRDDIDFKRLAYSSYSSGPVTITETTITRTVPVARESSEGDTSDEPTRISEYLSSETATIEEMFDDGKSPRAAEAPVFEPESPTQVTEIRTVTKTTVGDDGETHTTTEVERTVVTEDGTVEKTSETREDGDGAPAVDDAEKERMIKEMFANDKGVLDFFEAEQAPTDETEI